MTKVYLLAIVYLFFTFEENLEMEQYYITQAQQSQSNPSNNIFLHESPTVLTILITGIIVALFTHFLTKSRDKAKVRAEVIREFEVKFMTVNLDDRLKEINEGIRKNNAQIEEVNTNLSNKMAKGFQQINERFDNLIKGTKDEGQV